MLMQDEDRRLSRWLAGRVDAKIVYMKEQAKMDLEITVLVEDVYGQKLFYPACDKAKIFAAITKTKTLTEPTLRKIMELGYKVIVQHKVVEIQGVLK